MTVDFEHPVDEERRSVLDPFLAYAHPSIRFDFLDCRSLPEDVTAFLKLREETRAFLGALAAASPDVMGCNQQWETPMSRADARRLVAYGDLRTILAARRFPSGYVAPFIAGFFCESTFRYRTRWGYAAAEELWSPQDPGSYLSVYVGKIVIDHSARWDDPYYAATTNGLGAEVLNYLCMRAADQGRLLVRFDTFNGGPDLIQFYLNQGCWPVREITTPSGDHVIGWERPASLHRDTVSRILRVDDTAAQDFRTRQRGLRSFFPTTSGVATPNYSVPWLSTIDSELRQQKNLFTSPEKMDNHNWLDFLQTLLMLYKTPKYVETLPYPVPLNSMRTMVCRTRGELSFALMTICLKNREALAHELNRDEHNALGRLFRCMAHSEGILPFVDMFSGNVENGSFTSQGTPGQPGHVVVETAANRPSEQFHVNVFDDRSEKPQFRDLPSNLNLVPWNLLHHFQTLARAYSAVGGPNGPRIDEAFDRFHVGEMPFVPTPVPELPSPKPAGRTRATPPPTPRTVR